MIKTQIKRKNMSFKEELNKYISKNIDKLHIRKNGFNR